MISVDEYRLALSMLRPMNVRIARAIVQRTGLERDFFSLSDEQLRAVVGARSRLNQPHVRQEALEKARVELNFLAANGISTLYYDDPDYPSRLVNCDDAPTLLYQIGDCRLNDVPVVAVVGTRHATPYGIDFTEKLVERLVERVEKIVIVSGLAYGIDVAAHKTALRCGAPTVAVMAHPLNTVYPADHRDIAARIVKHGGAMLSEYSSQDAVHKGNFLARNRIVAGIADATVIVESDVKGGAMVTARIAGEYNRSVCAVPGRVTDQYSRGCNKLIAKDMAALVMSADDVINEVGWTTRPVVGEQQELKLILREDQQGVVDMMRKSPELTVNDMAIRLGMRYSELTNLLVEMEMDGLVTAVPGGRYAVLV